MWKSVLVVVSNWVCTVCASCCLSLPSLSHGTLAFVSVEYQGRWLLDWQFQDIFPIDFYRSSCQRELARVGAGWRGGGCSVRHDSLSISKIYNELFTAECWRICSSLHYRSMQQVRCQRTRLSPAFLWRALLRDRGCWEKKQVCALVLLRSGLRAGASLPGTVAQLGSVSLDDCTPPLPKPLSHQVWKSWFLTGPSPDPGKPCTLQTGPWT